MGTHTDAAAATTPVQLHILAYISLFLNNANTVTYYRKWLDRTI
jgi:hypothetical protein